MNLTSFDLNLLKAFDALYAERNVTRAGLRISLSQSAMSGALTRLRELFNDELFVRTPLGMQPTPRAHDLAAPISDALRLIGGAIQTDGFESATARNTFTLAMADYGAFVLLPRLLARLSVEAPYVDIHVRGMLGRDEAVQLLDSGEANLAVGFPVDASTRIMMQTLFREDFSCIARHGHPAFADGAGIEEYAAAEQLMVSPEGDRLGIVDRRLDALGMKRRVVLSLPQFLAAPFVVAETDLVATLATRVAQRFAATGVGITVHKPPLELPTWPVTMMWHRRVDAHPASVWLRNLITDVAASI